MATAAFGQGVTPITLPPATRNQAAAGTDGQKLVAEAARRLLEESAVSAELRCKIDALGHVLVGTGKYLQLGGGPEKLLRLELRMQVAGRPATLLEICGSDSYWVRRELPPAPVTLGKVNLYSLRKSLENGQKIAPLGSLPTDGWIMLGGLPRLLASIEQSFDFGAAKAEELQFTAAGDRTVQRLPIWVVEGRWKPDRLAALTGVTGGEPGKASAAALPEQLPDRVRLVLGRTEGVLPLFPYRITYLRLAGEPGKSGAGGSAGNDALPRELMTLELFNVHRKDDIDPREFNYNPGAQEVQDLTTAYVKRLSGETKLR